MSKSEGNIQNVSKSKFLSVSLKEKVGYLTTGYEHQNEFLAGKVGMIQSSIASYAYMSPAVKFNLGIAPLPANKKKAVVLAGTNVVIFSKASKEKQEAAWEFLRWMTTPENTARWAHGSGYLPLRKSGLSLDPLKKRLEEMPAWKDIMRELDYAYLEPRSRAWFTVHSYLEEILEGALRGKMTPQEALNKAAQRTEQEFKKEGK